MINRRKLFSGLIGLAAPAIIRTPRLLMPIRVEKDTLSFTIVPLSEVDSFMFQYTKAWKNVGESIAKELMEYSNRPSFVRLLVDRMNYAAEA